MIIRDWFENGREKGCVGPSKHSCALYPKGRVEPNVVTNSTSDDLAGEADNLNFNFVSDSNSARMRAVIAPPMHAAASAGAPYGN